MGDRGSPVPVGEAGAESLAEFENLLASFDLLPKAEKKPFTTLLEIANYPRSELACSNSLAFFLNPDEEHKLGSLVLNSLLEAAGFKERIFSGNSRSVRIIREERTDTNKSIDLVIAGESFLVGIENKIYAEAYNPFQNENVGIYAEFKNFSVDEKSVRDKFQELLDKISAGIEKRRKKHDLLRT